MPGRLATEPQSISRGASPDRGRVLFGVMLSIFLGAMESTVVATAMPTVVAALGGMAIYSWVFSGFLLASTVTMPLWGRLSDLVGRRTMFMIGMGSLGTWCSSSPFAWCREWGRVRSSPSA
jgi:MFS family permease